jgi:hypothetical protein
MKSELSYCRHRSTPAAKRRKNAAHGASRGRKSGDVSQPRRGERNIIVHEHSHLLHLPTKYIKIDNTTLTTTDVASGK